MTEDVLTFRDGAIGRIRLNRPKALHALNTDMCLAMSEALEAWRGDLAVDREADRPMLTAALRSKRLDFDDLATVLGAPPAVGRGETASAAQTAEARRMAATRRLLPDAKLNVQRVRNMDARVKYAADAVSTSMLPLRRASSQGVAAARSDSRSCMPSGAAPSPTYTIARRLCERARRSAAMGANWSSTSSTRVSQSSSE